LAPGGGGHAYDHLAAVDDKPGGGGGAASGGGGAEGGGGAGASPERHPQAKPHAVAPAFAFAAASAACPGDDDDDDGAAQEAALVARALEKTTARLMPVVLAIVGVSYLDRTALSFAGVALSRDLGLSNLDFGFASGMFFAGYCLFQLPSNVAAMRVGPRRWLALLMVAWGVAASSFAAIRTPAQLAGLRFALGAAEAGAFPALWYALSLYYPRPALTRPYATMLVAVAASQVVAAPLAAAMLSLDGLWSLRGWQIVFLAEGVPAVCLGLALPWLLPDGPADAAFLTAPEKEALRAAVDRAAAAGDALMTAPSGGGGIPAQQQQQQGQQLHQLPTRAPPPSTVPPFPCPSAPPLPTMTTPTAPPSTLALVLSTCRVWEVWVLALANIFKDMAAFAALFFCPLIVANLLGAAGHGGGGGGGGGATLGDGGGGNAGGGAAAAAAPFPSSHGAPSSSSAQGVLPVLLTAIPFGAAAIGTYAWSGRAQERGDPAWHAAAPFVVGGALFACFPLARGDPLLSMAALTAGLVGAFCGGPLIVVLVTAAAPREATAVALPLFNSVGMVGGFAGPVLLGWIVDRSGGSYGVGAAAMGCSLCAGGGVLAALRQHKLRQQRARADRLGGGGGASSEGGGGGAAAAVEFVPLKQPQPQPQTQQQHPHR